MHSHRIDGDVEELMTEHKQVSVEETVVPKARSGAGDRKADVMELFIRVC